MNVEELTGFSIRMRFDIFTITTIGPPSPPSDDSDCERCRRTARRQKSCCYLTLMSAPGRMEILELDRRSGDLYAKISNRRAFSSSGWSNSKYLDILSTLKSHPRD